MPSQFQNAFRALTRSNTKNFNEKYATRSTQKPVRIPSVTQFNLAREALRSKSPNTFNDMYGFRPLNFRGGKGRRSRKSTRRSRKSVTRKR